jgi:hypothetical protein
MPLLIYKKHTVVAGAARSQKGNDYIPVVYIAWEIAGSRSTHSVIPHERFPSFEEASEFAYAEGKAWVDRHVQEID